jgi:hypothetical protein
MVSEDHFDLGGACDDVIDRHDVAARDPSPSCIVSIYHGQLTPRNICEHACGLSALNERKIAVTVLAQASPAQGAPSCRAATPASPTGAVVPRALTGAPSVVRPGKRRRCRPAGDYEQRQTGRTAPDVRPIPPSSFNAGRAKLAGRPRATSARPSGADPGDSKTG